MPYKKKFFIKKVLKKSIIKNSVIKKITDPSMGIYTKLLNTDLIPYGSGSTTLIVVCHANLS